MGKLKNTEVLEISSTYNNGDIDTTDFIEMLAYKGPEEQSEICSCIGFYQMLSGLETSWPNKGLLRKTDTKFEMVFIYSS